MIKWLKQIEVYIKNDNKTVYAENALNEILDALLLKPCYYTEFCTEIDDLEDLKLVKGHFKNLS